MFLLNYQTNFYQNPYTQFSNSETVEKVLSGYRMTPPDNCPEEISKLMVQTWNESPSSRPEFKVHNNEIFIIIHLCLGYC
jgi:hypothetical protein